MEACFFVSKLEAFIGSSSIALFVQTLLFRYTKIMKQEQLMPKTEIFYPEGSKIERKKAVDKLVEYALAEVERKYGTGKGDGERPKAYHNLIHTGDVLNAAKLIFARALERGLVTEDDLNLVEIAAGYHDIDQDQERNDREEKSAQIAEVEMRKTRLFSEEDIEKVRTMIRGTKIYFEGEMMKQSATEDVLSRIISDADLSTLGQEFEIFWERSRNLLREMKGKDDISHEEEQAFVEEQINFLRHHDFYTDEANELFNRKAENIKLLLEKLVKSEA